MPESLKVLVLGASLNPERFSHIAVEFLHRAGHKVIAIGKKEGFIGKVPVISHYPKIENLDTISLYLSPQNQIPLYDYLVNTLKPRRIIFNPGTENEELKNLARSKGIEVVENCTIMMVDHGIF